MKRLFVIILFVLTIGIMTASADSIKDPYNGFYGLFRELTGTSVSNFNAPVTKDDANKMFKILFEDAPFEGEKLLNSDLVRFLAEKCPEKKLTPPLSYADAGLLSKDLRNSYSVLNGSGRLYSKDGFLNPEAELTYDCLLGSLSFFEDEILKNLSVSAFKGNVISVSLEDGITHIRMHAPDGIHDVKFKNMDTKNVFKDGYIAPYSRNIERNSAITAYTDKKGNGIYVKVRGEYFIGYEKLSSRYDLYKGYVYYIDSNMAIIKDISKFNGYEYTNEKAYSDFKFDENAVFEYNLKPTYIDYINENLLDKQIFIICDKTQNAKYFNISE